MIERNGYIDFIKRAIDRGSGQGKDGGLFEAVYEGYGPSKIAIVVEVVTDNKNRSAAEIKSFFDKNGGTLGQSGSVGFLFDRVGQIVLEKQAEVETQMLKLMDFDAQEVEETKE